MIARKLDSDFTITRRMIERTARRLVNEAAPRLRSGKFVQNYVFGGGGAGGFGGTSGGSTGKTTAVMYDPASPGTQVEKTRSKLKGYHGLYLQDNPGEDAVNVVADAVNDPLFWLAN